MKLQEERDLKAKKAGKTATLLPAIETMPALFQDLFIYYNAFVALSSSRRSGMGISYIPLSEIRGWLDEWGIRGIELRLEWIGWIQKIDSIYIRIHNKRQEKERKNGQHRGGKKAIKY